MKSLVPFLLFFVFQTSTDAQFLEVGMNFNYQIGSRLTGGSRLDTMAIFDKTIMDGEEVFLFNEVWWRNGTPKRTLFPKNSF